MNNTENKSFEEEDIGDIVAENDDEKLIPFIKVINNQIVITKEAKAIFNEYQSEELNFITVFGNESSGKSFLLNLILNIEANTYGAPWRKTVHNDFKRTSNVSENIYQFLNSGSEYGKLLNNRNTDSIKEIFTVGSKKTNEIIINMYPIKDGHKTTFFVDTQGILPRLSKNDIVVSENEKKLFLILITISNVFIFNFNNNNKEQINCVNKNNILNNNSFNNDELKKKSIENSSYNKYIKLASILAQFMDYLNFHNQRIEKMCTHTFVIIRDIKEENEELTSMIYKKFPDELHNKDNNFQKIQNKKICIKSDNEEYGMLGEEIQIYENENNQETQKNSKLEIINLPFPFKSNNNDDSIQLTTYSNELSSNFNKNNLSNSFSNKVNDLKSQINLHFNNKKNFSSCSYKAKILSGRKITGNILFEYLDLVIPQLNDDGKLIPIEHLWIFIVQRELHKYHSRAISIFLENLNLTQLILNYNTTNTNFNYNNSLLNNYITYQTNNNISQVKPIANVVVVDKNEAEIRSRGLQSSQKQIENINNNVNATNKLNNVPIKVSNDVDINIVKYDNVEDVNKIVNFVNNEDSLCDVNENTMMEEYILMNKINDAKTNAIKEYEKLIVKDNFSQFKDYVLLYEDSKKDLYGEMKRIEKKLINHNARRITTVNLNLLESIYVSLRQMYKSKNSVGGVFNIEAVEVKENQNRIITEVEVDNQSLESYFCPYESLRLLISDYDSISIGKSKVSDLNKFLYSGRDRKITVFLSRLLWSERNVTDKLVEMKETIVKKGIQIQNLLDYKLDKIDEINYFNHKMNEMEFEKLKKMNEIKMMKDKIRQIKGSLPYDTERNFMEIPNTFQKYERNIETLLTEDKGSARHCTCNGSCLIY